MNEKLPRVTAVDAIRALERAGFSLPTDNIRLAFKPQLNLKKPPSSESGSRHQSSRFLLAFSHGELR
jgi:hypothetical protein